MPQSSPEVFPLILRSDDEPLWSVEAAEGSVLDPRYRDIVGRAHGGFAGSDCDQKNESDRRELVVMVEHIPT